MLALGCFNAGSLLQFGAMLQAARPAGKGKHSQVNTN